MGSGHHLTVQESLHRHRAAHPLHVSRQSVRLERQVHGPLETPRRQRGSHPHLCGRLPHSAVRKFQLSFDALKSAHALEEFLLERAIAGDLRCADLSVFDMETWRTERFKEDPTTFEAPRVGWFMYYIVGRIRSE